MKVLLIATAVSMFPLATYAHNVQIAGSGITITCDNGAVAKGSLNGTEISFEVTEPDGSKFGMNVAPSGGSPDPAVAFGDGKDIAKEVCGN